LPSSFLEQVFESIMRGLRPAALSELDVRATPDAEGFAAHDAARDHQH
jgi:hypothetical protein